MTGRRSWASILAVTGIVAATGVGCSTGTEASFCDAVGDYADLQASSAHVLEVDSSTGHDEATARVEAFEEGLRESVDQAGALLDRLDRLAPADLRAEVEVATALDRRYFRALETNDFDLFELIGDPSLVAGPEEVAAVERVADHTRAACDRPYESVVLRTATPADVPGGVSSGSMPPASPPTPPTPPAPPGR